MVGLPPNVLSRYPRFSVYNSPYTAHDDGCAIDLYPDNEEPRTHFAPSPVTGEVVDTRTVTAPSKPYAVEHDHLIVVDTGDHLVRMLHVDPAVDPGDTVDVGDSLGELVRSGFFAPWVANHIHLGFRKHGTNPVRASGSLSLDLPVEIEPLAWDGTGRVVETGGTFVVLDSPTHPAPGNRFAGIQTIVGDDDGDDMVLDGGLPHYEGGGVLGTPERRAGHTRPVSFLGSRVGLATGRNVTWDDVEIRVNGDPITGISLFVSMEQFGAKLVCPGHDFSVGDPVSVSVR